MDTNSCMLIARRSVKLQNASYSICGITVNNPLRRGFSEPVDLVIDWANWPLLFLSSVAFKSVSQKPTIFDRVPPLIGSGIEVCRRERFHRSCDTASYTADITIAIVGVGSAAKLGRYDLPEEVGKSIPFLNSIYYLWLQKIVHVALTSKRARNHRLLSQLLRSLMRVTRE